MGCIVPSFSDFLYYYQMDNSGFSLLTYSMLSVLGFVCLFFSTLIYNKFLKTVPIRKMMITACFLNLLGAITTILFVKQITFGLSPIIFVVLTSTVMDTLVSAFTVLPAMVLFAKLIPQNVESSMFALLTGVLNFCSLFAAKELGVLINRSIGVTTSNLSQLWKLYVVQASCCLLPIIFVALLPTREQV